MPSVARPTGQLLAITDEQLEELPFAPAPLQELLRLLVKAIRAHQMYLPNNPVYRTTLEASRSAFAPVWEHTDEFSIVFSETEIKWFGVAVMAEPTKAADSLPWTFFKDGIREVSIKRGFEFDELEKMLDILQRARNAAPEQDDLLTMLWEADFIHLRYRYVDVGTEAVAPIDGEHGGGSGGGEGEPASPDEVRAAAHSPPDQSRPGVVNMQDFDATLYFLDEKELDYLRREIEREYAGDLRRNVVSILLDIWEAQPAAREEIADIIETLLLFLLASGELRSVAYLLAESTVAATRGNAVTPEHRLRLAAIPEHLSADEPLGQLLQALDETADQAPPVELAALFAELRPAALGTALAWIPRLRNASVRAMVESAADRLAVSQSAELVKLVLSANPVVSAEAIRRCTVLKVAAAVPSLSKVLSGDDATVRLSAVHALAAIGSLSAMQALERSVDDSDREVRLATVKAVLLKKHRGAFAKLEHKVKEKAAASLDMTERTVVFEAYGAMCGEGGIAFLDQLLNGKGFFGGREDPETRACAAMALGRIGTKKSKESLQKAAEEKDVVVRNAVFRALKGSNT
jgi:HEAT repeat protein